MAGKRRRAPCRCDVGLLQCNLGGVIGLDHGAVNSLTKPLSPDGEHSRCRLVARQRRYQLVVAVLACTRQSINKSIITTIVPRQEQFRTRYENRVSGLITVLGSQRESDRSHKPGGIGCHYFPPDSRLPVQPQRISSLWPVPNYTARSRRHMGTNNMPKSLCCHDRVKNVVTLKSGSEVTQGH